MDEGLIFTIDSDGSMTPTEIELLADALVGGCSIVKGSRNLAGARSDDITRFRKIGNNLLTSVSNKLCNGSRSMGCHLMIYTSQWDEQRLKQVLNVLLLAQKERVIYENTSFKLLNLTS